MNVRRYALGFTVSPEAARSPTLAQAREAQRQLQHVLRGDPGLVATGITRDARGDYAVELLHRRPDCVSLPRSGRLNGVAIVLRASSSVAAQGLGFTISAEALTAITDITKTAVETAPSIVTSVSDAARKKAAAKKKKKAKQQKKAEVPVEAPAPATQKPAVPAWAWPAGALAVVLTAALLLRPAVAPQVAAPVVAREPVAKKNPKKKKR